jgi:hypothetical protein
MTVKSDDDRLHALQQRVAGFHFMQEQLSPSEREIFLLAEALLKYIDKKD